VGAELLQACRCCTAVMRCDVALTGCAWSVLRPAISIVGSHTGCAPADTSLPHSLLAYWRGPARGNRHVIVRGPAAGLAGAWEQACSCATLHCRRFTGTLRSHCWPRRQHCLWRKRLLLERETGAMCACNPGSLTCHKHSSASEGQAIMRRQFIGISGCGAVARAWPPG
jgi:hypothetical protein